MGRGKDRTAGGRISIAPQNEGGILLSAVIVPVIRRGGKNETVGSQTVERAPNVHYAGRSHYFGFREAACTAAGTIAAGFQFQGLSLCRSSLAALFV